MTDYKPVQDALASGAEPAMLCATCPWDRSCVTPPVMTRADIDSQIAEAAAADKRAMAEQGAGKMPVGSLLTALMFGGRDTAAQVCPVFALRLKSGAGRGIADSVRSLMQGWDDAK
jgi:hypothetical protein